jgi:hypothetical protein
MLLTSKHSLWVTKSGRCVRSNRNVRVLSPFVDAGERHTYAYCTGVTYVFFGTGGPLLITSKYTVESFPRNIEEKKNKSNGNQAVADPIMSA